MGVVVKTHDKIISIDTANIPFVSIAHNELTSIADIFLVTHADADHYDRQLLAEALKNKKTIIFPEGFYFTGEDNNPNIYKLKSGQRTNIDGIYVTAFKTDHRGDGNFQIPNCWFLIEVDGFKILHTGDGLAFQNPTESQYLRDRRDIDIMLTNLMLSDENIRNIKPNVAVPLHLFKYIHSREQLKESTFESAIAKYDQKISGIDMKMLFAGEGFEY
jgi:L-ascorbate metabolism protein UlaG (beta-lactamase superfamily)